MKLNLGQWLWLVAWVLYVASLLLGVADVVNLPTVYILLGAPLLVFSGWWLMPSMEEMRKAQRKRS